MCEEARVHCCDTIELQIAWGIESDADSDGQSYLFRESSKYVCVVGWGWDRPVAIAEAPWREWSVRHIPCQAVSHNRSPFSDSAPCLLSSFSSFNDRSEHSAIGGEVVFPAMESQHIQSNPVSPCAMGKLSLPVVRREHVKKCSLTLQALLSLVSHGVSFWF